MISMIERKEDIGCQNKSRYGKTRTLIQFKQQLYRNVQK